jgi:prepilin-type processing-associated H-X9-DG protein
MQLYANDHSGTFPRTPSVGTSAEAVSLLVPRYSSDTATFSCPGKPRPIQAGQPVSKQTISYAYYMGLNGLQPVRPILSDEQVNTNAKTPGQLVFSADGKPPANNHGNKGGNLLFTDGHVENSPPQAIISLEVRPGEVLLNP